MENRKIRILGVPVACVTYDSALEIVSQLAREPRPAAVCPANTHILAEARHEPEFACVMERFDLVLPDGMPVVWTLNLCGAGLSDRVYGPYFTRHALKNTPRPWRHFFFGDTEEVLEALKRVVVQLQPNIESSARSVRRFGHGRKRAKRSLRRRSTTRRPTLFGSRCRADGWKSGSSRINIATIAAFSWR